MTRVIKKMPERETEIPDDAIRMSPNEMMALLGNKEVLIYSLRRQIGMMQQQIRALQEAASRASKPPEED